MDCPKALAINHGPSRALLDVQGTRAQEIPWEDGGDYIAGQFARYYPIQFPALHMTSFYLNASLSPPPHALFPSCRYISRSCNIRHRYLQGMDVYVQAVGALLVAHKKGRQSSLFFSSLVNYGLALLLDTRAFHFITTSHSSLSLYILLQLNTNLTSPSQHHLTSYTPTVVHFIPPPLELVLHNFLLIVFPSDSPFLSLSAVRPCIFR